MTKEELQRLRDLPIERVAERLGIGVSRHKALCPFHDDHHASLSFHPGRNTCRCFVCMDRSLGTVDLAMRALHLSFPEACRWLARDTNILLTDWHSTPPPPPPKPFDASRYAPYFQRPWLNPPARQFLYDERHIDPRVVRWCRLTSWTDRHGTPWLQIPYYDKDWTLVGVQNRRLEASEARASLSTRSESADSYSSPPSSPPRFRFPPGARCTVYNLPVLSRLKPHDRLFITEGCSDCWAMLSSGEKAIAIPSATLLTREDKDLLRDVGEHYEVEWHMFPDHDAPGERLFLQLQQLLPGIERHQLPAGCKDYGEWWRGRASAETHD
jgi:hypothetical protein